MDDSDFTQALSGPGVCRVAVPSGARALSTLAHIDYADAFVLEAGPSPACSPEQGARLILEDAPFAIRIKLLVGWSSIGLRVGIKRSGRSVLGWQVRRSSSEFVLLGADSRIGMPGELLFMRQGDALLFATFVRHDNVVARAVWALVEPQHLRVVRYVLEQSGRRFGRTGVIQR
jgi:hypothetical protein